MWSGKAFVKRGENTSGGQEIPGQGDGKCKGPGPEVCHAQLEQREQRRGWWALSSERNEGRASRTLQIIISTVALPGKKQEVTEKF